MKISSAKRRVVSAMLVVSVWVAATAVGRAQAKLDDATILSLFEQANTADIETAQLGVKRARSSEVRSLARGVAADHQAVRQMGRDLARKLSLTGKAPEGGAAADHAKALATLQALSGDAFDRAYVAHEVAFHAGVIDAVKTTLIPSAQNAEVRALLEKVLPGFEHHLAETRALAAALHVN